MFLDRLGTNWHAFQSQVRASVRVLVVDDEPSVCLLISELLSSSGYSVDAAGSLGEARALLEGGVYQLLVLDKNLPDGSGVDLLKERRSKGDETPAILITGYPSAETVMDALTAGAADYISKPFEDVTLVQERLGSVVDAYIARSLNERMVRDLSSALEPGGADRDQVARVAERLFGYKKTLASRPSVLVIEDNLAVAEVIRTNLTAACLDVQVATDLRAATAWIQRGDGPLTALVSVDLPPAMQVITGLREIDPLLEIVVTTGSTDVELALAAVNAGAADYVLRPFEGIEVLRARIQRAVARARRRRLYLHLITTLYHEAKRTGSEAIARLVSTLPELESRGKIASFQPGPVPPAAGVLFPEEIDLSDLFGGEAELEIEIDSESSEPLAPVVSIREGVEEEPPSDDVDARDRRQHQRVGANLDVRFQPMTEDGRGFGGLVYSHLRDVSAGGMFIAMDRPFPIGTRLSVELDLGWGLDPVTVRCEVVRRVVPDASARARSGIGVRFEDSEEPELKRLISGLAQRIVPM